MQFDVRAAKALRAGEHLTVPDMPGLRLEASASGRAWTYRYRSPVDGRMRQIKLGAWPTMSAPQAGVEWEKLRGQREAGRDPSQERRAARQARPPERAAPQAGTVGELLEGFTAWAAPRRADKGAAELRRTLEAGVPDELRGMAPGDVTRSTAFDLIARVATTPVQASALRRELGAAWDWAHDSGRIPDTVPNWWRLVLRGKLRSRGKIVGGKHQGAPVKRALSLDEVGAVLRHLPHVSRQTQELLTLYLWTGCRGAEIVQMEGSELAEVAGVLWWTIPRSKVKMARHELAVDLPVPLVGRAREVVLARRDVYADGYMFPKAGGKRTAGQHIDQKTIGVAVYWHMPRCRIRPEQERARWPVVDWAPHDLRRTVRTHLARLRCPDEIAEAVLGHIDTEAGVYNRHAYRDERLEWLTRLSESWEAACRR